MNSSWKTKKFGEVFDFKNGRSFKKSEWKSQGLPIIRIQNLNDPQANFNYYQGEYNNEIEINDGDLLFSWSGTIGSSFGPHIWNRGKGLLNQHIFKVNLKEEISKEYSYYFLKYVTSEIEKKVNGAVGLVHISKSKLNNFEILIPSISEQKRIVKFLDEFFEKITQVKEITEKNILNFQELFESYFNKVFVMPGIEWKEVSLDQILEIERGGSPRPIQNYLTTDIDGINWIKIGDTKGVDKYIYKTHQKIKSEGLSKSRLVKEGDFILSNSMSFGRPYIMKTTGAIHDGWLVLREKNRNVIDTDYLYDILSSPYVYSQFDRLAAGSTVRNLNINLVSSVKIPLPSVSEQKLISTKLNNFSSHTKKLKSIYKQKLNELEELKKTVFHKAFKGEFLN